MAKARPEKKSETLEVRLPHSKKEAFKAACEAEGITASHAVRTFIDAYLKQSRRVKLKTIAQDITMKLFNNPLKTAAVIGTGAAAAVFLSATPSAADDRDALPINAPYVTYPLDMAKQEIGAECEATFDVSVAGIPINIVADCTHPGFIEETKASAATLRFEPKIKNGEPVIRTGVVYPLLFQIEIDESAQTLQDAFAKLDKNADGQLTGDENISQDWIDVMDQDANGHADFAEYELYLKKQSEN